MIVCILNHLFSTGWLNHHWMAWMAWMMKQKPWQAGDGRPWSWLDLPMVGGSRNFTTPNFCSQKFARRGSVFVGIHGVFLFFFSRCESKVSQNPHAWNTPKRTGAQGLSEMTERFDGGSWLRCVSLDGPKYLTIDSLYLHWARYSLGCSTFSSWRVKVSCTSHNWWWLRSLLLVGTSQSIASSRKFVENHDVSASFDWQFSASIPFRNPK